MNLVATTWPLTSNNGSFSRGNANIQGVGYEPELWLVGFDSGSDSRINRRVRYELVARRVQSRLRRGACARRHHIEIGLEFDRAVECRVRSGGTASDRESTGRSGGEKIATREIAHGSGRNSKARIPR